MEQKLRAVVKLQEMAAPILKKRGKARSVWAF
jgi:phage terminase Nu1 subunit (DNA packaging protein)